ncbi:hypothetical protein ACFYWN_00410 [Streptomyces sp. NPDC002917]|uniref:hypothetical protein n=1 Tax=Streptomyces sp. NPDC002917 TaxID=3364671 RepID=UPI00367EF65A
MLHLLTSPRASRTVRGLIGTLVETAAGAVRSLAAPTDRSEAATAPDPADVYTDDEMPAVDTIETAAAAYERAADQARRADRGKRAAKKILDRLPVGLYGAWIVERVTSSRETADLDAIRATYKRLGLGAVPMKRCAPSLKVRRAEVAPAAEEIEQVAA